jgi:hypothetical protein
MIPLCQRCAAASIAGMQNVLKHLKTHGALEGASALLANLGTAAVGT